ncbi:MAG: RNA polymerase sigma factor [Patescibacteria group bacterium]|jgi:RNA polymerase sigma-70 factor (ECF subfamily)
MEHQFLELYDDYYPKLYAYILMRVRHKEQAEDIVQQTFLKALENVASFKPRQGATFGSWVFQIAKNELIDRSRQKTRLVFCDTEILDAVPGTSSTIEELLQKECDAEQKEKWLKVLSSLDRLDDDEREVITLKYLSDLPYKEIAKTMNKKPNTLAVILKRALEKVRKDLHV